MIKTVIYKGTQCKFKVHDSREHIQKHWMNGSFYETQRQGLLNYIYKHYKGGVMIDAGASIGNHTVFFSRLCLATVIAVEPVLKSFAHLCENVRLNSCTEVEPIQMALGSASGTCSIEDKGKPSNNIGMMQVIPGDDILMGTLDSIIDTLHPTNIKLIKMDVEHYQIEVIKGAKDTLKMYRPDCFIEAENDQQLEDVIDEMYKHSYKIVPGLVFNHTPTYLFKWSQRV